MDSKPVHVADELGRIAAYIGIVGGIATFMGWLFANIDLEEQMLIRIMHTFIGLISLLSIIIYLQRKEIKYYKFRGESHGSIQH